MERARAVVLILGVAIIATTPLNPKIRVHLVRFLAAPYELVIAVETGFKMHLIESELWRYYRTHKRFPSEPYVAAFLRGGQGKAISSLENPLLITDHWDRPFLYRRLVLPEGYELVCMGRDGVFGTKDDVIFRWREPSTPTERR